MKGYNGLMTSKLSPWPQPGDIVCSNRVTSGLREDLDPTITLYEGNSFVIPNGAIALVLETDHGGLIDPNGIPVLTLLFENDVFLVMASHFDILKESTVNHE